MHTPPFTHAGVVCLRDRDGVEEVLCVRPSVPVGDQWVLPKGHIDPGEEAPEAAVREAREEAGAVCRAPRYVGVAAYRAKGEDVVCAFYAAELVELGEPEEERERRWVPLGELERVMPFRETIDIVLRAAGM